MDKWSHTRKYRIENKSRVLLTSAPGALFKYSKLRNYSLKKSNISIFNALDT
jgi:hypothetical protein